jgi:flagellar biosynthesis protein FlhF
MKIKKFIGQSFKDALEIVKDELGPDAIILSSKSIKSGPFGVGNRGAVEVTAAIDESVAMPIPAGPVKAVPSGLEDILREIRGLRDEVGFLKETLRPIVPSLKIGKDKKGLYNLLVSQGVDAQFAIILLERAEDSLDSLKKVIVGDMKVQGLHAAEEKGLVFLGPSGVGKTTTMSKVAQMLTDQKKRVNLLTLDTGRIGAMAHMKELSGRLKCQFKAVKKITDLPKTIYKEIERGPVLIDTPGHDYKELMEDMKAIFPGGFPLKKCFLMDASMNADSVIRTWQTCDSEMIDTIGFTKLDMAARYGGLYNLSLMTGRPLSFITTGPDMPDAIKVPSSEFLAGLIVGGA